MERSLFNGKVQAEGQFTDNRVLASGNFITSQKSGTDGSYNNGRPDGLWNWYYDNGTLRKEEEYFQDSVTDVQRILRDGRYYCAGQYSDGEKNGYGNIKPRTDRGRKYITD